MRKQRLLGDACQYVSSISLDEPIKVYMFNKWHDARLADTKKQRPNERLVVLSPQWQVWAQVGDIVREVDWEDV